MLDKKNQDGPQEDLDDILKDFDEQDERISGSRNSRKRKKRAARSRKS